MLNRTLTPHNMINGNACFVYFNKIWGIPLRYLRVRQEGRACRRMTAGAYYPAGSHRQMFSNAAFTASKSIVPLIDATAVRAITRGCVALSATSLSPAHREPRSQ